MASSRRKKFTKVAPVFEQIGFSPEESAELVRKSHLFDEIQDITKDKRYTHRDLVQLTGLGQSHVSELLGGKLSRFSTEKLIIILEKLGASVEIRVKRGA